MEQQEILDRLERIEKLMMLQVKEALTASEVAMMLDITEGRVRALTSKRQIPYYKCGVKTYYSKREIEQWMLSQRVKTQQQIEQQAATHVATHPLQRGTKRRAMA